MKIKGCFLPFVIMGSFAVFIFVFTKVYKPSPEYIFSRYISSKVPESKKVIYYEYFTGAGDPTVVLLAFELSKEETLDLLSSIDFKKLSKQDVITEELDEFMNEGLLDTRRLIYPYDGDPILDNFLFPAKLVFCKNTQEGDRIRKDLLFIDESNKKSLFFTHYCFPKQTHY